MGAKNDDRVEAKPDSTAATVQAVIHVAEETSFVHFYLACGHLITIKKGEMPGKDAKEMKCWACSTVGGRPVPT